MRFIFALVFAFFCPAALGTIGAVVGIGAGLNSMFGGSDQQQGQQQSQAISRGFTPYSGDLAQASYLWSLLNNSMYNNASGAANAANPLYQQAFQNQAGIDYSGLIGAGNQAGQQYGNMANMGQGFANSLMNQAGGDISRQGQIWNTAADPMNALHDRTQQQVVDASRAGQSARGIAMSPYGAGIENKAVSDFNLDWQNNMLGRLLSGSQAANQTGQLAGADMSGAMGFANQVPGYMLQQAQMPIQGQMAAYGGPSQAANAYIGNVGGSQQLQAGVQNQAIPYLNFGQGVTGQSGTGMNTAFNANQAGGLEALLTGLGGFGQQANTPGSWLNGMFGGSPNQNSYNAEGTFQPFYTGMSSGGGAAYG